MWLGHVFGSGADSLAEVKGKWFPAVVRENRRGRVLAGNLQP